nr:retrovirus-related Pol polyprotein from transposon TNT 1-94 [Tanacetum cinerariifolium]
MATRQTARRINFTESVHTNDKKEEKHKFVGISQDYIDHGDPTFECSSCGALLWYAESMQGATNTCFDSYSLCCGRGKVTLTNEVFEPPPLLKELITNKHPKSASFIDNIRRYNSMFAFTSMGGKQDTSVNVGRGTRVTMKQYFAYRIQERKSEFSIMLNERRLFQQFIVDAYTMIESERLTFNRKNDKDLRSETYSKLANLAQNSESGVKLRGKSLAFCLGKTLPVSKLGCVLCQDFVAFCLEDFLRFVLRPLRFVSRPNCVLSQDLLRFVSRLTAFCLQSVAFCLQASCVLSTFEDLFISFEDIQCTGSDTRPPMLDMTDFASWQQRSRLYCQGKENGVNILKSIDEGSYQIGTVWETLDESTEGAPQFGPERPRVYSDLTPEKRSNTVDPLALMSNVSNPHRYSPSSSTSSSTQVSQPIVDNPHLDSSRSPAENLIENLTNTLALLTQSYKTFLPQTNNQLRTSSNVRNQATVQDGRVVVQNVQGRQSKGQGMNPRGRSAAGYGGAQNRVGNDNSFDDDVDEQPVQDLALNVDNVFQADDCDAFDSDVDEAPTAQTMFMANLSSADPVTDEAEPSYDSDILSEVQDHDHYQDAVCAHHEEHTMHDSVQLDHVVDSFTDYTSDSNMIPYDQYVKDNEVPVVHSNVSSIPNDAFMMLYDDIPIKALIVYPPNTPATLVPKVLPTKSQVKIHIFTLIQLFSKFDKTCKKRITPTGLTEGEKGFEQTKDCYLKEVKPFFKTLKDNFEGIQKALTKEIKEMKDVFEELEAEVAHYAVDRKHDAIERKNLLIANDNLIAECLSKEVFSMAINSELNVARFTEMTVAHTTVEARCLELEAELAKLCNTSHHDNQEELINRFSKLEVNHLNLQLKYQNLKDSFGNNPSTPDKDTPDFDSVFVIGKMQAYL